MYNVDFFKGYNGKVLIGLTPEEVIKNIPDYETTLWGYNHSDRRDFFQILISYYDKENKICEAIQFVDKDTKVYVNGVQFMDTPEKNLIPKLKKIFPNEVGFSNNELYIFPEKSISFFVTEGSVGGIMIGKQGYFDDIKNETGSTRWRRF